MNETVTIYHRPGCPFCRKALALLQRNGIPFVPIDVGASSQAWGALEARWRTELARYHGGTGPIPPNTLTVPQMWTADDRYLGGCSDLETEVLLG